MNDVAVRPITARDLIAGLLEDQQSLTAVDRYLQHHESATEPLKAQYYRDLIPLEKPGAGEQYAFQVDLDACSACKACVSACHHLNGLEVYESWREVGSLLGDRGQKTVTTACHHCAEPACADGCPVLAYEKDSDTGIVRHLDDQCIGCRYCEMKCPYGVPKYSVRLGVVRKCDMCYGRLVEDEAPACVQACPNEAITIKVVETKEVPDSGSIVPGAFDSSYTRPTTEFIGWSDEEALRPANETRWHPAHAHYPLVFMLVLTQAAVGLSIAALAGGDEILTPLAAIAGAIGLGCSVLHLGKPLKAWRSFLGWRKSWLSREIIVFGAWFPAVLTFALTGWTPLGITAITTGVLGVVCSIMVYASTRREFWSLVPTAGRFLGTVLLVAATPFGIWLTIAAVEVKLAAEFHGFTSAGSRHLMRHQLLAITTARLTALVVGLLVYHFSPLFAMAVFLVGEFLERVLFFRAVIEPEMP